MKFLKFSKRKIDYYIKMSFFEGGKTDSIADGIVNWFMDKYITRSDKKLVSFLFQTNIEQTDFDNFIANWDIEAQGGHKALLLSYFMKKHPELKYPEYIEPRLKGLMQYHRFRNIKLMAHFKRVCSKLREHNINFLIIKGGAMHYLQPDKPRMMGDIDILVEKLEEFELCRQIVDELGYKYKEFKHSIDLHEDDSEVGILDIHHRLRIDTGADYLVNEDLFKRATREKIYDVDGVFLPSYEDMMFILLINLCKNLMQYTSIYTVLYSIFDCVYLLQNKPDFDWEIVKQNTVTTKTEAQVHVAIKFINEFVPEKLPELFKEEFKENSILYLYNEWFLKKLRKKSHSLDIKEMFLKLFKKLKYYFRFRPQYILYRRKSIKENPKLAKIVLENQKLIKRK